MAIATPDNTKQVEDRIKADVQREAVDSNPYLRVSWLRSIIAGFARRIFDFYKDLERTELRLMPDTADDETAPRWGAIYTGAANPATVSSGKLVATGTAGSQIPASTLLIAGEVEYIATSGATIAATTINVLLITRSGATATVTTTGDHNLASKVLVTLAGAAQTEYNVASAAITVTGLDSFTYQVTGAPATPATGTITAAFTSAIIDVQSVTYGITTNLDLDAPVKLQSPIASVDDTLSVYFGTIGGGSDAETPAEQKVRYLDKIRNPIAHYSVNDIVAKAKEVTGVSRVFVESAGDVVGTAAVTSITRTGNVATVTTTAAHGYDDGQQVTITGANQGAYNVVQSRIIVENTTVFHFIVAGTPTTPATGTILTSVNIPLGQSRVFFMRDGESPAIPTASEVQTVKDILDTIRPANTSTNDLIVKAPTAVVVNYTFTNITPDTPTMRSAIEANILQFHEEQTTVGVNVDADAYRAAIINTIDIETGAKLVSFVLSSPTVDVVINSGEIATKGLVTF